jgi:NAD(P)-dependent dehydrogenase (short-subunit alcohol dehydrogenase family)
VGASTRGVATTRNTPHVAICGANNIGFDRSNKMANTQKTVIVTGASQGIGAAVVKAFLERGYNVVGTSRSATKSAELKASDKLVLVDGDIGQAATAKKVVDTAVQKFGSIDAVVNNAGIFSAKPFTDYSADDFRALVSTNLEGYIYITQLAVKQMLAQKSGGSVTAITSSLVDNPIGGLPVSLPMITKGGLDAITRSLASEYSKEHIRFNTVAPGVVDTPLHKNNPKDFLKTLSPMGTISTADEIASAVVYLTESRQITGEVLHVDGGAHNGKW